jgi:predicted alpha/beta hydrolase
VEDLLLAAADGTALAATRHPAAGAPRAVVVVNSGTGIRRRFYGRFAARLAARGLEVLTWDYRGVGGSRPGSLRGHPARMRDWGRLDMPAALRWARAQAEGRPVAVVGHSAGGHLAGLVPAADQPDALVLVAAQDGYWGHWPPELRLRMRLLWWAMPRLAAAFGHLPGWLGVGEDLPRGVAAEWSAWARSPGYLFDDPALDTAGYAAFHRPLLALSFADDRAYAPRAAVEALLARFPGTAAEHRHLDPAAAGLPPVGHFGFFKPVAEPLWDGVADWILDRARA